jgi:hypothetical protein
LERVHDFGDLELKYSANLERLVEVDLENVPGNDGVVGVDWLFE